MGSAVAQRNRQHNRRRNNDLESDYSSWAKRVDREAERIQRDPHAYLQEETKKSMKESLPRFLHFLA